MTADTSRVKPKINATRAKGRPIVSQPTMQQVAERAGVSTSLVSLVMRDAPNVSDHRRQRVLEAADELGYRPNVLARNLAARRTNTIGVVVNDLANPFFTETLDSIQRETEAIGRRILVGSSMRSRTGELAAVETFLQFRVDGIVLIGARISVDEVERAASVCPLVTLCLSEADSSSAFDSVSTDDAVGARLAVEHLAALGHRRIAHITGGTGAGADARQTSYIETMQRLGLGEYIDHAPGDYTEASGYDAAERLLAAVEPPTAIFAANDLSALGALDCADDTGLSVPVDLSVIGFDNTALAAMHHVMLTTVDQPTDELCRQALELLLARVDDSERNAEHRTIAPTVVTRNTTAGPRITSSNRGGTP